MDNLKEKIQQSHGTDFQKKVWLALLDIPRGQTRTYMQIAKAIKKPKAWRAVGSAVGKNPFAPQVPCHRVVPVSGGIGQYSGKGGVETKRKLLASEGVTI